MTYIFLLTLEFLFMVSYSPTYFLLDVGQLKFFCKMLILLLGFGIKVNDMIIFEIIAKKLTTHIAKISL